MKWFRCWSDIKDDPKMLGMSDRDFRLWIHLLALVSEEGSHGILPSFSEKGLASSLNTTPAKWGKSLSSYTRLDMVRVLKDGRLQIRNWAKRQYESDNSTPRVQRFRNARRNNGATLQKRPQRQIQRTETDTDTDPSLSPRGTDGLFEDAFKRKPSPLESMNLGNLTLGHPTACLDAAFLKGAAKGSPEYTYAVLAKCGDEGHLPRKESTNEPRRSRNGRHQQEPGNLAAFERFEPATPSGGDATDDPNRS